MIDLHRFPFLDTLTGSLRHHVVPHTMDRSRHQCDGTRQSLSGLLHHQCSGRSFCVLSIVTQSSSMVACRLHRHAVPHSWLPACLLSPFDLLELPHRFSHAALVLVPHLYGLSIDMEKRGAAIHARALLCGLLVLSFSSLAKKDSSMVN